MLELKIQINSMVFLLVMEHWTIILSSMAYWIVWGSFSYQSFMIISTPDVVRPCSSWCFVGGASGEWGIGPFVTGRLVPYNLREILVFYLDFHLEILQIILVLLS